MTNTAIERAVEILGLQPMAKGLGVTYQAIRKWQKTRIPAERVLAVEAMTLGRVTRHELRPDLYPFEVSAAASVAAESAATAGPEADHEIQREAA